jgi:hypothetical protein
MDLHRYNTLILSDLHLGSETSHAREATRVLKWNRFQRLILLGDIFADLNFPRLTKDHWKFLGYIRKLSNPKRNSEVIVIRKQLSDVALNQKSKIQKSKSTINNLKSKYHARRQAEIVLRRTEERCAQVVAFDARCNRTEKPIIEAAAQCSCERSIRGPRQGSSGMDMRAASHGLGKGSELAHGHGESQTDQIFLFMAGDIDVLRTVRCGLSKALRAIVSANVAHDAYKGQDLSLERGFPSMKIGTGHRRADQVRSKNRRICTLVRKSEEYVSGGYLGVRQACEKK